MTNDVGHILTMWRAFYRLTQDEMAKKLNIQRAHLVGVEAGRRPITMELLGKYSAVLGIRSSVFILWAEVLGVIEHDVDSPHGKPFEAMLFMARDDDIQKAQAQGEMTGRQSSGAGVPGSMTYP